MEKGQYGTSGKNSFVTPVVMNLNIGMKVSELTLQKFS